MRTIWTGYKHIKESQEDRNDSQWRRMGKRQIEKDKAGELPKQRIN